MLPGQYVSYGINSIMTVKHMLDAHDMHVSPR